MSAHVKSGSHLRRFPKDSEKLAQVYLSSRGLAPIVYEPDGNVPPDFLVDGRIAVEVRRLNQHEVTETGEKRGLETTRFALHAMMRGVVQSLGPPKQGKSWFVNYEFSRPLPPLAQLRRRVRELLTAVRDGELSENEFAISERLKIDFLPSTIAFPLHFIVGGSADEDSGGWLVSELERNIKICLDEKGKKIAPLRPKYPEWWLILVDFIGYGAKEPIEIAHEWDKLILLNPLDPAQGVEL